MQGWAWLRVDLVVRIGQKGSKWRNNGGISSSKDPGIQDNHERGNQPRDVRVV